MKTRKHYYSSFFLMIGSFIKKIFKPKLKPMVSYNFGQWTKEQIATIMAIDRTPPKTFNLVSGKIEDVLNSISLDEREAKKDLEEAEREYKEAVEEFDKKSERPLKKIIEVGRKKSLEIGTSALIEIYSDSTFIYALQCGHNLDNVVCTTLKRKRHDHYMWLSVEFHPYWLAGVLKETFPHIKDLIDVEKITYEDFEKAVK